jgi:uncharacterized protein with ParB-like and HNH nuclease domain
MPIDNSIQNRTFEDLFQGNIRYEVPFFQRAYSWERIQWKQLFDDIWEQIIIDVIDRIKEVNGDQKITTKVLGEHLLEHEHYFGAIVVLEKRTSEPSFQCFTIIDGQQRITTVYLLLGVISKILKSQPNLTEHTRKYIDTLDKFLKNSIDTRGDDYRKLKVFSNKGDRLPTYLKIFGNNPTSASLPIDQQLYIPRDNQIERFWEYAYKKFKTQSVGELYAVSQAVLKSLKIVWIPLDEKKDNPQAIFEGLNDKGMVLSAVELLCSYLFKPLINEITKQHEVIHNEKWLTSIKKLGGEKEFEFYIRNLFSIDKPKKIGIGRKLYSHFKNTNKNIDEKTAYDTIENIAANVDTFNNIYNPQEYPHQNQHIRELLIKIKQTGMDSSIPFTLSLMIATRERKISESDTETILNSLLVLLVRRKICGVSVTKYDVFFPTLLGKIINEPDKAKAFKDQVVKADLYVPDQEFEDAFINKALYNQRELEFARLILREIDKTLQVHGQLPDYSTINTIEHIIPQTLDEEWTKYLGQEATDINLERYKNSIGNLCLISGPANSSLGQDPFEKKKNSYTEVSGLTRDIKSRTGKWNITAVKSRSKDLADKGLTIWNWN